MNLADLRAAAAAVPSLRRLFEADPHRAERFTLDACGIHADFSRQHLDAALLAAVERHADAVGLTSAIDAMFAGRHVNATEGRAALHVALRARGSDQPEARFASERVAEALELAEAVRSARVVSSVGRRFATVVNVGIGGSDLGPAMVTAALRRFHDGPETRFVSNVDPADLDAAIADLDPSETLVVVASKTFTTSETMANADRARRWIAASCPRWQDHFVAVTAAPDAARDWGVPRERCLVFADWVGGRFSVSSVVGFPVMCAVGPAAFSDFLDGMHEMDLHHRGAPFAENLPVLHAVSWWTNTVLRGRTAVAVVPYASDLALFVAHLQQLVMESNGKGTTLTGGRVDHATSPVVFGGPGTDGQHAYFQLLHQGAEVIPVDFVGTVAPTGSDPAAHEVLVANLLAQSDALATGRSLGETEAATGAPDPHRSFPGDRPSTVLFLDYLDPRRLGSLLSLYEHSVHVQGVLSGINSFDQFGVELGKQVAGAVVAEIGGTRGTPSLTLTHPLLRWWLASRDDRPESRQKD